MQQQPGTRQMAQKSKAKPCAIGGALDDAGNVSKDKAAIPTESHYA